MDNETFLAAKNWSKDIKILPEKPINAKCETYKQKYKT